jgi:ABC-type cobalamin/Fe3+-siderophores transport system ATPase subunit
MRGLRLVYNIGKEDWHMTINVLPPQDLVRQAVIEVARLPEQELVQLLAYIDAMKERSATTTTQQAVASIRTEAAQLAVVLENQPRSEAMAQMRATMERIRAQAIADGTAIDGDWHGD